MENISLCTGEMFETAIERYSNMVYRLAMCKVKNKQDAEDVFQEVFIRLFTNCKSIQSEEHMKAWLIRVTINYCNSSLKAKWRSHIKLSDDVCSVADMDSTAIDVYQSVMTLPDKYRTVIHLFYYEDMSIAQIAHAMSQNQSTIRVWLTRARKRLKQHLAAGGGDYGDI